MNAALATVALIALAGLMARTLVQGHGAARRRLDARQGYFDACLHLFSDPRIGVADSGFARLNGSYGGHLFDLQALPDTLTYRKLPSLWLLVSIPEPMPLQCTLDFVTRPIGTETFSKFSSLPVQIETPPGFPPETAVRADSRDVSLTPGLLEQVTQSFYSSRVKEVILSPAGVRIVWLAEEANRGRYLLFRDSEMGMSPLDPAILRPILDHVAALAATLRTGQDR